ncbi:MAG: NADH-quinone oxidoreductase subunit L, partial [Rhodospirillales bacterium]|nr:NADH-quinone oxidoreductase subunit L [Rhodospirillales bacterium]
YSKDIVLEAAFAANTWVGTYAFWMGIAAAFMTAFYSWRLLLMTFHGKPRANEVVMAHVHESPKVMIAPLVPLALGALFAGYIGYEYFVGHNAGTFWGNAILILEGHTALEDAHHVPMWVKYLPLVMGVGGIALAYVLYMFAPGIPARIAGSFQRIYQFLLNKWYFDELYDFLFVRPAFYLGRNLWKSGDGALIDGVGPDGVAAATLSIARRTARLQSGYLFHYAFATLIGVVVLITWYLLVR